MDGLNLLLGLEKSIAWLLKLNQHISGHKQWDDQTKWIMGGGSELTWGEWGTEWMGGWMDWWNWIKSMSSGMN